MKKFIVWTHILAAAIVFPLGTSAQSPVTEVREVASGRMEYYLDSYTIKAGTTRVIPFTVSQAFGQEIQFLTTDYYGPTTISVVSPSGITYPVGEFLHAGVRLTRDYDAYWGTWWSCLYFSAGHEVGEWKLQFTNSGNTDEGIWYIDINDPSFAVDMWLMDDIVDFGDDFVAEVTPLRSGSPVLGVQIGCDVSTPATYVRNVCYLRDDGVAPDRVAGDGTYAMSYTATEVGRYYFTFNIAGMHNMAIRSEVSGYVVPENMPLAFVAPHAEDAVDEDGDGLYEYLQVEIGVSVPDEDYYNLDRVELWDANGNVVARGKSDYTSPWYSSIGFTGTGGISMIPVQFDGRDIFHAGTDGPYFVYARVEGSGWTYETGWIWGVLLEGVDIHTTQAYTFDAFQHDEIMVEPGWDVPVDYDGDGEPDALQITASIAVSSNWVGDYTWTANLVSEAGTFIAQSTGTITLTEGIRSGSWTSFNIGFDWLDIDAAAISGPYVVDLMLSDGPGGASYFLPGAICTFNEYFMVLEFSGEEVPATIDATAAALDLSTGALVVPITISNNQENKVMEKVFWYAIEETGAVKLAFPTGTTNTANGVELAYVDVSAQVNAQLPAIGNGDMRLDQGESVTFNVAFYTRDRLAPIGHVFAIWADPPTSAGIFRPQHARDADGDRCIDDEEVLSAVEMWFTGYFGDFELLETIGIWKAGGYSFTKTGALVW